MTSIFTNLHVFTMHCTPESLYQCDLYCLITNQINLPNFDKNEFDSHITEYSYYMINVSQLIAQFNEISYDSFVLYINDIYSDDSVNITNNSYVIDKFFPEPRLLLYNADILPILNDSNMSTITIYIHCLYHNDLNYLIINQIYVHLPNFNINEFDSHIAKYSYHMRNVSHISNQPLCTNVVKCDNYENDKIRNIFYNDFRIVSIKINDSICLNKTIQFVTGTYVRYISMLHVFLLCHNNYSSIITYHTQSQYTNIFCKSLRINQIKPLLIYKAQCIPIICGQNESDIMTSMTSNDINSNICKYFVDANELFSCDDNDNYCINFLYIEILLYKLHDDGNVLEIKQYSLIHHIIGISYFCCYGVCMDNNWKSHICHKYFLMINQIANEDRNFNHKPSMIYKSFGNYMICFPQAYLRYE